MKEWQHPDHTGGRLGPDPESTQLITQIRQSVEQELTRQIREIVDAEFERIAAKVTAQTMTQIFHMIDGRMMQDRLVIEVKLKP